MIPPTTRTWAVTVVSMSANRTVTAVDLAKQLRWDAKKLRGWLRSAAATGHPLLRAHGHNDSWVFTSADADQLRGEARRGPWKSTSISLGVGSNATSSPMPMSRSETAATASAAGIADELSRATPTSASRPRVQVPAVPGLYAWWHAPGLLPGITHGASGPTLSADGNLELAYVGIAGSLHGRLSGDHLGSSTGKSTLRRALGAWLGAEQGWITEWRSSRVQHDAMSEKAMTTWMEKHLSVTWVRHESPHEVESGVIAILAPPLNHQLNQSHPNWPALDAARLAWRRRGTPASG